MEKMPTIKIIFALLVAQGWKCFQIDIKMHFSIVT